MIAKIDLRSPLQHLLLISPRLHPRSQTRVVAGVEKAKGRAKALR
jgi:hypothetical protein